MCLYQGRLKEEYESEKPDEITTRGQSISMSADKARRVIDQIRTYDIRTYALSSMLSYF